MSVAWQKQIRDQRKQANSDADLFGHWWSEIDVSIAASRVEEVSYSTAEKIIKDYEWLGTMPAVTRHCFGIYFDGACGGVVVYGDEYAENLGVWDKYGYTGKIICLARGACTHWAHPHSASKLIRRSMKMLPERFRVVTCTVDAEAGEVGTIYQACGFDYVGVMSAGGKRASVIKDGRRISCRHMVRKHGTRGVECLTEIGVPNVAAVARKGRYFGFRGHPKEVKQLRSAISHLIQPYPKRQATTGILEAAE